MTATKSLSAKIFFYVITKNSNWEVLTKNLVAFKRKDEFKDEKRQYFRISLKNPTFRRGVHKKTDIEGRLPKKGAWTVCRFKEAAWQERGGVVFEGGVDTPMHTMSTKYNVRA